MTSGLAYNPIKFHTDFEVGMIKRVTIMPTKITVRERYFNFPNSIYRKIQNNTNEERFDSCLFSTWLFIQPLFDSNIWLHADNF